MLGLLLAGPTIMAWGTQEQKDRYLAPIVTGDEIWCQGFSEPEAGSDLAGAEDPRGQARRRLDRHRPEGVDERRPVLEVVHARRAHRHRGGQAQGPLATSCMDMEQDAVQVRPLRQITGESEFNELFIEEARIPDANLLGGEGNGWKVALTTLMNERAGLAFFLQVRLRQLLDRLLAEASERGLLDDPVIADKLGELHLKAEVLRLTAYRGLTAIEKYGQPGPEGSLTKWMWSETNQQLTQFAADLLGPEALQRRQPLGVRAAARSRQLDRGRHHRDPQEHRRRARARAAEGALGEGHGFRSDRRPEGDQARRARAARRPARRGRRCARRPRPAATTPRCGASSSSSAGPGIAVSEEHGGQGLGAVELAVLAEELGLRVRGDAARPDSPAAALAIEAAGSDAQRDALAAGAGVRRDERRARHRGS